MLWWDEGLCRMLADHGRFVVRYDHRDTGRSVTYPHGRPGYSFDDLIADAVGILDAYGIPAAHVVGVSMGGAIAQLLALDFADRVRSLVLISTSFAVPTERALPRSSARFAQFVETAEVDWSDASSVAGYVVDYLRVLAGEQREFDEAAVRDLIRRDAERARDFTAAHNHDLLEGDGRTREPLSSLAIPTLVIHGSADPMFPPGHGEALADEIRGARFLALDGAGHGVERADWETIAGAIAEHTARR